jgi:hypothetical protein
MAYQPNALPIEIIVSGALFTKDGRQPAADDGSVLADSEAIPTK